MTRPLTLVAAVFVMGLATTALAIAPAEIIAARKTPSSKEAIALPMAEKPPADREAARAGWMYIDVDMRKGGSQACVCLQDNDATLKWSTFGGTNYECD